jgi:Barstar (barnase inhibitor)
MNIDHQSVVFNFVNDALLFESSPAFLVRIDPQIVRSEELLNALYFSLWLPGYFGFNWNALYDCLCDLSWIPYQKIILVHSCMPKIPNSDLKAYLEVLRDSVLSLQANEVRKLEVVFPLAEQAQVQTILSNKNS